MKIKSMFMASTTKITLLATCIFIGFLSSTKCDAQSIVGKWKGVSAKYFYSAEYAKRIGKPEEEKTEKEAGESWGEYKADHTFTISFSALNSSEVTSMKGTWSLTGNELKSTLEPQYNPKKLTTAATFVIDGNTMITTTVIPPPSRIVKTISTSKRM